MASGARVRQLERHPAERLRPARRDGRGAGAAPVRLGAFRFRAADHTYLELASGEIRPHITGLLEAAGWIDTRWYTEDSSERGVQIHRLTADYDLGALDPATCDSGYKGYLLGHVKAMAILRPEIYAVEEPVYHAQLRFGGRPDRLVRIDGLKGVLEGKSGEPEESHEIQTALQAILVEPILDLPANMQVRYCLYWRPNGRFKLEQHVDQANLREARKILREHVR